jgi:hypothetical protein
LIGGVVTDQATQYRAPASKGNDDAFGVFEFFKPFIHGYPFYQVSLSTKQSRPVSAKPVAIRAK